ncbi:MAG: aminopeptidase P family N-terminal domain-containing protein [Gemmataceae bacterium]
MDHHAERRDRVVRLLREEGLAAVLVTSPVNVTYLTGFTGDTTALVLTADRTVLVSDPRYVGQIADECLLRPGAYPAEETPDGPTAIAGSSAGTNHWVDVADRGGDIYGMVAPGKWGISSSSGDAQPADLSGLAAGPR